MSKTLIFVKGKFCAPCKTMEPQVDSLKEITVEKIFAEENMDWCREVGIRSTPSLVLKEDDQILEVATGVTQSQELLAKFK